MLPSSNALRIVENGNCSYLNTEYPLYPKFFDRGTSQLNLKYSSMKSSSGATVAKASEYLLSCKRSQLSSSTVNGSSGSLEHWKETQYYGYINESSVSWVKK